jgi:CheY-like chemotaxis protein
MRDEACVRILLIEDDAFKAKRLCSFLRAQSSEYDVVLERSVSAGLTRLFAPPVPDILLLDMSLSTFDVGPRETGGRPQNFGGITVLEHMLRRDTKVPALVITQFESFPREGGELSLDDLSRELSTRFPEIFKSLIYYSSRETEWERRLRSLVSALTVQGFK